MPYSSNDALPDNVKNSLSDEDQTKWRKVFNSALEEYGDEEKAFAVAWAAVQKSDSCRHFSGWASVEVVDKQGDKISARALAEAMKKYIARGGIVLDSHTNRHIGHIHGFEVMPHPEHGADGVRVYGTLFRGERLYDVVWNQMLRGEKNAFSIGGDALKVVQECDPAGKCWNRIDKLHLFELSTVRNPANQGAYMDSMNDMAKFIVKQIEEENDIKEEVTMTKKKIEKAEAETEVEETAKEENSFSPNDMMEFLNKFLATQSEMLKMMQENSADTKAILKQLSTREEPESKPEPPEEEAPEEEEEAPPEEEEKPEPEEKKKSDGEEYLKKKVTEQVRKEMIERSEVKTPDPVAPEETEERPMFKVNELEHISWKELDRAFPKK